MYELTQTMTADAGLPAYEISNHSRPGASSRHNLVYWRYGDYAGIGPGAHGRLTLADGLADGHSSGGRRIATVTARAPGDWLGAVAAQGHAVIEQTAVELPDQATEYMLMAMRLTEGADLERYTRLAGSPVNASRITQLARDGLVQQTGGRLAATARGRIVLNRVLAELLA